MLQRLITFGPRIGFVLLIAVLVGFELLFVAEARAGASALETERALRETRAAETLDEVLFRALDVAEARLEALETLPLVEEDGLLLVRDGVQYFPRLPGAAGTPTSTPKDEAEIFRVLESINPGADEAARKEAVQTFLRGEQLFLGRHEWTPLDLEVLGHEATSPVLRVGLMLSLIDEAPPAFVTEHAQGLVLRAWPWISKGQAARACMLVRRRADQLGLENARFGAACQRGLTSGPLPDPLPPERSRSSGTLDQRIPSGAEDAPRRSDPGSGGEGDSSAKLVGEWLMVRRGPEVRGVHVDLPAQLTDLRKTLLEPGEHLATLPAPRGEHLVGLQLISPRLEAAHATLRAAMWWKTLLLAVTGLLGLSVVLLARLAERRKEETLALQREFIATVSHELRTPLAGIRLLAETLERKLGTESLAKDYPHRLVVAADGLGFLVENILSFNRLEAGRWVPRREPYAFASLEPLLREDATLAVDATVEVRCEGLAQLAAHHLDAQLIRVLVQNLLRNAWKYGGRQPVQFHVAGHDEGATAVLRFTDNGPGIPVEERERVFEAFHRIPPGEGRAVGGSGLGLALARRIAELHGGSLRISASSEAGTTFELRLPR